LSELRNSLRGRPDRFDRIDIDAEQWPSVCPERLPVCLDIVALEIKVVCVVELVDDPLDFVLKQLTTLDLLEPRLGLLCNPAVYWISSVRIFT